MFLMYIENVGFGILLSGVLLVEGLGSRGPKPNTLKLSKRIPKHWIDSRVSHKASILHYPYTTPMSPTAAMCDFETLNPGSFPLYPEILYAWVWVPKPWNVALNRGIWDPKPRLTNIEVQT